jgi:hypothetical protein
LTTYEYEISSFILRNGQKCSNVDNDIFENFFKAKTYYKEKLQYIKNEVSEGNVETWFIYLSKVHHNEYLEEDGSTSSENKTTSIEYEGNI